ncbi:hypothetical protein C5B42_00130 [Candidatus Cerribacteria bacterium 'Amazon FNV 2010 28 9']|uniref:Uncharacterized protein n=1 Tax=Candidatus Cerribacteria bacterium 'Amazon FNV 2010 28 9' TaxID=2081795 RepID=A0A317JR65_9BACT|nr:MAG: hypothetical protein C5B42_00130 [Candidatus Cerribacteria bacterium 'Amazon FNV 2010 28 9']
MSYPLETGRYDMSHIEDESPEIEQKIKDLLVNNPNKEWDGVELIVAAGLPEFHVGARSIIWHLIAQHEATLTVNTKIKYRSA